jgi:ribonucleotide reductase beta subunit family protein with ferritin-like domain
MTSKSNDVEYLLKPNPNRFVIFPIKHMDIWESFQKQRKAMWFEHEVDLVPDIKDWKNLNDNERYFIKNVLAFFVSSDGIVMENLGVRFFDEIQIPEARAFYSNQMFMENIHSIMYSQLIDTYITDENEKNILFKAIDTVPSIKQKADWAIKWIQSSDSFATRLVAFAAVEGIFFSGSFCCIYWLNERGIMPGLCKSNEFIARDEGMHTDFACLLYKNYIKNKLTDIEIHEIIKEAVDIESYFITESLPCKLLGMNSNLMKQYIKFVANRLLVQLGHSELYPDCTQPFSFMDRICLESKTNFFESRPTEYQIEVTSTGIDDLNFNNDF